MKKKVFVLIHIVVLLAVILCSCVERQPAPTEAESELYPMTAVVDRLEDNDKVVCVDYNENVWVFEGIEDWQEGDIVAMMMDTCGTDTIYDDEIVDVRYCGSVKGLD